MKRAWGRVRAVAPVLAVMIGLTAALGLARPVAGQDGGFPRTVVDASGRVVLIPDRPARIAVAGDYPILRLLVLPGDLFAVTPGAPDAAAQLAGAELLVVPTLTAAAYPDLIRAAEGAGIPAFQVAAVDGLAAWRGAVEALGQATGREASAADALSRLDRRLTMLARATRGARPVRTLTLTPEGYTFGAGTLYTELVEAAGGVNLAAEAGFDDYRQVDDALIRALEPDVILLTPGWGADGTAAFAGNPAYADVPAVASGRVLRLPFSPTFPPDPAAAALWLALALHPDRVPPLSALLPGP